VGPAPNRLAFEQALRSQWREAQDRGDDHVDVVSSELHRLVGGYPGSSNRMPMCCDAMYAAMGPGDKVLKAPPKRKGASVVVRYRLPRGQAQPLAEERGTDATPDAERAQVEAAQPPKITTNTAEKRRGHVGLVGCVKKKLEHEAPAENLHVSPLFRGRRAYVERSCERWLILSALHGVVRPEARLEPYDVTLNDASPAERRAWATRVLRQLDAELGSCTGLTFELHAGANYADFGLVNGLRARGAMIERPVAGLKVGQQLAFYAGTGRAAQTAEGLRDVASSSAKDATLLLKESVAVPGRAPKCQENDILTALDDLDVSPTLVPARDWPAGVMCLDRPGLYAWVVDDAGAADLSRGLGLTVDPGRIYAGLAGATWWPSGKTTDHTLGRRIGQMHLGGKVRMSTFRWTLASLLFDQLEMRAQASMLITPASEQALTEWMCEQLSVAVHPHDDRDTLAGLEHAVLERLDPPFNLRHMQPTPVRRRLSELRRRISREAV